MTKKKKTQQINNPVLPRLYDIKKAAQYMGCSIWTARTLIWNGSLPYIKFGRKYFVDVQDINRFIEKEKQVML